MGDGKEGKVLGRLIQGRTLIQGRQAGPEAGAQAFASAGNDGPTPLPRAEIPGPTLGFAKTKRKVVASPLKWLACRQRVAF